jgi:hypothetical protein
MGHPAAFAGATVFRLFSSMEFALWTASSIVRFWRIMARNIGPIILWSQVVCFVGF